MRFENRIGEGRWLFWGMMSVLGAVALLLLPFGCEKMSVAGESDSEMKSTILQVLYSQGAQEGELRNREAADERG